MRSAAVICLVLGTWLCRITPAQDEAQPPQGPLYVYTLSQSQGPAAYDEALAAACLQGLINREGPRVYVLPAKGSVSGFWAADESPARYWLDVFSGGGRWLEGRTRQPVQDLDALRELAGSRVAGAVIWDPAVPATVNVATTIAGVKDGLVMSPEFAASYRERWKLPVLEDLRGRFDGSVTGSAKNDAYRWAIDNYLRKGLCSSHFLFLFEDAHTTRAQGNTLYVVTRDWAVFQRGFVYDLSPWSDETPADDRGQPTGTDVETYRQLLQANLEQTAGRHLTEVAGFFAFQKYSNVGGNPSRHEPVPTEWETVWLISPYNCYQNTVAHECYNQSFHSQAPLKPLKQQRPAPRTKVEDRVYLCILMADYDSATPLYDFLPRLWQDPGRGKIPLCWGINPSLIETYPDVIRYFYETATPNDHFASDASCAGYNNPNRILPEHLPLFTRHNQRFFQQCDMSMAPMVLDWDQPTAAVKDAFTQFAPDGFATIVMDLHGKGGAAPQPHVWKGMPVMELINNVCNFSNPQQTAESMWAAIGQRGTKTPGFHFFRIVWTRPSDVIASLEQLQKNHPDVRFEVLDPYNFFALFRQHCGEEPDRSEKADTEK